jgi:hypothetical protein
MWMGSEFHWPQPAGALWALYLDLCSRRSMSPSTSYFSKKQTPWPLVRNRTIPTEGPPLVDEI